MDEDIINLTKELMSQLYAVFLATIDEHGSPYIRAVFNLRSVEKFPKPAKVIEEYDKNPLSVYISTNTASVKVEQIKRNDEVALYYCKPNDVKGIMLKGKAEILDDMDFKKQIWDDKWKIYYPEGVTDPDFTILRIIPKYLKGWHRGHLEIKF